MQGSTEKLSKQKEDKEEAKDQQDSGEQERAETDSFQNGVDATKENTPKKIEKRQSFGGFFKGLVRYLSSFSFFSNPSITGCRGISQKFASPGVGGRCFTPIMDLLLSSG